MCNRSTDRVVDFDNNCRQSEIKAEADFDELDTWVVKNPTDAQLRNYNNWKPPKVKSSTFHGSVQYYDAIKNTHELYYTRLPVWNRVANAVNGDAVECRIDLVKVILQRTLFST